MMTAARKSISWAYFKTECCPHRQSLAFLPQVTDPEYQHECIIDLEPEETDTQHDVVYCLAANCPRWSRLTDV